MAKRGSKGLADYPHLIKEWHPSKNEHLTPLDVTLGTSKRVWWKCGVGHEWQAKIQYRTSGSGCPFCSGRLASQDNNLAAKFPLIAAQWHPNRNAEDSPLTVTPKSNKMAWWICEKGHEWTARVADRTNGNRCPYCSNRKVAIENSLASKFPIVASEWHPTRNGKTKAIHVAPGSEMQVWWQCSKGHEWRTSIKTRTKGSRCPQCTKYTGKVSDNNNLGVLRPDLVRQWHQEMNDQLLPEQFTLGSRRKVWWKCESGHVWQSTIGSRSSGRGCPFCSGALPSKENNFQVRYPDLCREWDADKNGSLKPHEVTPKSQRKVWWKCKRGHVWRAKIADRAYGTGCPKCSHQTSKLEIRIFCELGTILEDVRWREKKLGLEMDVYVKKYKIAVEIDSRYHHEGKADSDLRKAEKLAQAGVALYRLREAGLEKPLVRDIDFTQQESHLSIIRKLLRRFLVDENLLPTDRAKIIDYLSQGKLAGKDQYREILVSLPTPLYEHSLESLHPTLAVQWDTAKNAPLEPRHFKAGSNHKVWWKCEAGHSWQASIDKRVAGRGCPYCTSRRASSENNLACKFPLLAEEWNQIRNGGLLPNEVTPGSSKQVWWTCQFGHEWKASVGSRVKGNGCPYCSGRRPTKDNNLEARFPKLAAEWHPVKNGCLSASDVTPGSGKKVWWRCYQGHEWEAKIASRTYGAGCPLCPRGEVDPSVKTKNGLC
jgi:hypothetical protein